MAGRIVTAYPSRDAHPIALRPANRTQAQILLEEWGCTPFSRIAMGPGYRHTLLAKKRCVIAWAKRGPCALALGEPVGPEDLHAEAVIEFAGRAKALGLHAVFVPVAARAFDGTGFRLIRIGRTARWNVTGFDLQGGARRSIRQSVRRAEREALRFELNSTHGHRWPPGIFSASNAWLAEKTLSERHFGTGRFDSAHLSGGRVALVRSRFGRVEAFVSLVEGYSSEETAIDLMRRRPDAPPGAMDLLLVRVALALRDEGTETLNLGLAPLAGLGSSLGEKALAVVYRHSRRVYNFEGLDRFKAKFEPQWDTAYLAYPSAPVLPRALVAAAEIQR